MRDADWYVRRNTQARNMLHAIENYYKLEEGDIVTGLQSKAAKEARRQAIRMINTNFSISRIDLSYIVGCSEKYVSEVLGENKDYSESLRAAFAAPDLD